MFPKPRMFSMCEAHSVTGLGCTGEPTDSGTCTRAFIYTHTLKFLPVIYAWRCAKEGVFLLEYIFDRYNTFSRHIE